MYEVPAGVSVTGAAGPGPPDTEEESVSGLAHLLTCRDSGFWAYGHRPEVPVGSSDAARVLDDHVEIARNEPCETHHSRGGGPDRLSRERGVLVPPVPGTPAAARDAKTVSYGCHHGRPQAGRRRIHRHDRGGRKQGKEG